MIALRARAELDQLVAARTHAGRITVLASGSSLIWTATGIWLWGLRMAMTQGLLATMVAETAPPGLRGTAFGFFNLMSGQAMLLASTVAGVLWDQLGAPATFAASAVFILRALGLL